MNSLLSIITACYSGLLHLYPLRYREEFAEEMLLDFSDMAIDASKKGISTLLFVLIRELRDLPFHVFYAHYKEGTMSPNFRPGAGRKILRTMIAFGLAFALMTLAGIMSFMDYDQFIDILRFLHSIGWQGTYQDIQPFLANLSGLTLGPLMAASILLIMFPKLRPIKKYMPIIFIVFAIPALLSSIHWMVVNQLSSLSSSVANTLFGLGYLLLVGLGFGLLASFISKEGQKLPVFLFMGILGYFVINLASASIILRLPHGSSTSFWYGVVSVALRNMLIGMSMGLFLGIVTEYRKNSPQISV